MEQGLLINCTHDKVLRFLPPYILTEQDVDRAVIRAEEGVQEG